MKQLEVAVWRHERAAVFQEESRFSGKNVSKTDRFSTAGSCSTCPKSGLTVAASVASEPSPTLHVHARRRAALLALPGAIRRSAERVGNQLEPARRRDGPIEDQVSVQRDSPRSPRGFGTCAVLVQPANLTLHVSPDLPWLGRCGKRICENGSELRVPARVGDLGTTSQTEL